MSYKIQREQFLPISIEEAWEFFSRPENLGKLTPDDIGFEITHNDSERMHEGQIICYKIEVFPLIKVKWVTEITHVEQNRMFIDNQRVGPYRLWHHTHEFEETDGGIIMKDTVHYALPFGIMGTLAHALFVRRKLKSIFDYREKAVLELFPSREIHALPTENDLTEEPLGSGTSSAKAI